MSEATLPAITVIEDMDYPDCIGAYWGEINTTIQKGFGLSGALTNGVMRDLGDLVHADQHGALFIPLDVIDTLEAAIEKLLSLERIVLGAARKQSFDFDTFQKIWNEFERYRT